MKQFCNFFYVGFCVPSLTWAVGFLKDILGDWRIKYVLEKCRYLFL